MSESISATADSSGADLNGQTKRRSRWVLGGALIFAVTALNLGIYAASHSQKSNRSKQQELAEVGPATAQLENRRITETLVMRCRYAEENPVQYLAPSAESAVSSINVSVGTPVTNGQLVMAVSGRPVFAVQGDVPMYRDISPMNKGQDVAQLQTALAAADLLDLSETTAGTYDWPTQQAVQSLWALAGFEPTVKENSMMAVDDARVALELAQLDLKAAQGKAAKQRATLLRDQAATRLWQATIASGPTVPRGSIMFVPELPANVVSVKPPFSKVAAGDSLLALTANALVVQCRPSEGQLALLSVGMRGTHNHGKVESPATVSDIKVTVKPNSSGPDSAPSTEVVMTLDAVDTDGFAAGDPSMVRIAVADTGEKVLSAPSAALRLSADGTTSIDVVDSGTTSTVNVDVGVAGGGWVELIGASPEVKAGTTVLLSKGG